LAIKIERKQARQNTIEHDSPESRSKPALHERNILLTTKNSPSLPDIHDSNQVKINGIGVKKLS